MKWFFIALLTPILHSTSNFVDKILLSKYFENLSLYVFMIYATVTTVVMLPIFIILGGGNILQIPYHDIIILIIAGLLEAGAIYFYLVALYREEASIVVPFFQLIPIASFILSFAILGETLSAWQMIGSLIIIFGAAILSFEMEEGQKMKFRYQIVLAMIVMAVFMGLAGVLFKFVAVNNNFWISNFWESLGFSLLGMIIFFAKKIDRDAFYDSIKLHKAKIVSVVLLSEVITTAGNVALNYAFLLAPIALARTVESYQPVFVLILGVVITKMFPKLLQEKTDWRHLAPKILAILVIFVGSYFILS